MHGHEIFKKELVYIACHCCWGLLWWYTLPTSSFTEYASSVSWQQCYYRAWSLHWQIACTHILQNLVLALVRFPPSIIGTVIVIASPSLNHVCSYQYKYASYSITSVSLGSVSVTGIACKGSGMFFTHAMHIFVNLSKEKCVCVFDCFCTK